jgi:3-oxoacyl-[acyl-carrier protein] reductase
VFLDEGARVVINSSNPDRLNSALSKLKPKGDVAGVVADLRSVDDLDRLVSEPMDTLGGVDTLVYVTGSPKPGVFMEQSYESWEDAAKMLTVSPAYLCQRVAEKMIEQSVRGRMVLMASYAIREPLPNIALSNVCRIAVAGIVRTLARELGPKHIRVNGILPGYIRTNRVTQLAEGAAKKKGISVEKAIADIESEIPLGYIATPEELAKSIVFLGSELSSYVTGALLPVDGGALRSVG